MQIIQNTHFRSPFPPPPLSPNPCRPLFPFFFFSLHTSLALFLFSSHFIPPLSMAFALSLLLALSSQSTNFVSLGRQPNDCLPLVCFLIPYLIFVFSSTFPKLLCEIKRGDWLVSRFAIPFPRQQREKRKLILFRGMSNLWRLSKLLLNMLQTIRYYINFSISIFSSLKCHFDSLWNKNFQFPTPCAWKLSYNHDKSRDSTGKTLFSQWNFDEESVEWDKKRDKAIVSRSTSYLNYVVWRVSLLHNPFK